MYAGIGGVGCGYGFGGSFWGVGAVVVGTLILIAIIAIFSAFGGGI